MVFEKRRGREKTRLNNRRSKQGKERKRTFYKISRTTKTSPLIPQDPFFEQLLGQYAPTVARMVARTRRIFMSIWNTLAFSNQKEKC